MSAKSPDALTLPTDPAEALADILCLPEANEPPESRRGRLSDRVIKGAAFMVRNSNIMDLIETYRQEDRAPGKGKGGRPKTTEEEVVLILLITIVAAGEAPLVTNLAHAYRARLSTPARNLLGLPVVEKATQKQIYHRVYRALHRVLTPLDPYPCQRHKRPSRAELEKLVIEWEAALFTVNGEVVTEDGKKDGKPVKMVDARLNRLRTVSNLLLESAFMLLPHGVRGAWKGNISIDATVVHAGGKAGAPSRKKNPKPDDKMSVVPQTGWYKREDENGKLTKLAWGYEAHLAVMAANEPGVAPDFPLLVLGMSLDTPATRIGENAVVAAKSIIERGHPAGICAADRAYFPNSVPAKYQLPMRALGYRLIGDYREDQLGVQTQHDGALLVEGNWYCPGMPQPLIDATLDLRQGKISEKTYLGRIEQRGRYAFRPKQAPTPDGNIVYHCPGRGSGRTADCPLAPQATKGPIPLTLIVNPPASPDKACTNSTSITLPIAPVPTATSDDDLRAKHFQDIRYATSLWQSIWSTLRNTVEGVNAYNKDPNWSDLEEAGRRRLRGFAAQAFLLACQLLGSNIRKIETFMLKRMVTASPPPLAKTKPRRHKTTPDVTRYRPDPTGPPLAEPA